MRNFKTPLAMSLLCLLVGCDRDTGAPAQPAPSASPGAPAAVAKRPATPEEQTAGMVEAATQGKSQLPVVLKFELASRPEVGAPLDIGLALIPAIAAAPTSIAVTASDGLSVAEGSRRLEIPQVEPTQVYRQSVKVTPNADGVLFVTLTVTMVHDQVSDTRVFALPIIVGAPPAAPAASTPVASTPAAPTASAPPAGPAAPAAPAAASTAQKAAH